MLRTAALVASGLLLLSPAAGIAGAQPWCADLGGTLDGNTCRVHTSKDAYTIDASVPVDYADEPALINYVTQTRDGFVNVSQMPGSKSQPYELDIRSEQYRSGQPPRGTQSVVLTIFQDVGGAHPSTWYKAFNYNLDTRQPITFDTLFKPGTKPVDVLYPIVKRDLERQSGPYSGTVPLGDGHDPVAYQNFAITDTELIFYFGQGDLQSLSAGASSVRVPREAVASILA